jgi:hypothetical protein
VGVAVLGMLLGLAAPAAYALDTAATPHRGALPLAGPTGFSGPSAGFRSSGFHAPGFRRPSFRGQGPPRHGWSGHGSGSPAFRAVVFPAAAFRALVFQVAGVAVRA